MRCRGVLERNNETHIHARTEILAASKMFRHLDFPPECLRKSVRPSVTRHVTNGETWVECTQNVSNRKIQGKLSVAVSWFRASYNDN